MLHRFMTTLGLAGVLGAGTAMGAEQTFNLSLSGDQEVGSAGDPDGLATGTLTVNDTTGEISWNFTYTDITAPSAMHIHGPGGVPGVNAGVFVDLGIGTSGVAGTLIDSTTTTTTDASAILAEPGSFYVNIHNSDFPSGALRGQVPEPGSLALLALGSALLRRRRR